MRLPNIALTVALALCAAAMPADAGVMRQGVHGRLAAQVEGDDAIGRFRISHNVRDNTTVRERLTVEASHVDPSLEHRVFLVSSDGLTTADFGAMIVTPRGKAGLRFTTRYDVLPEGVTDLTVFGGGTVEVRTGDAVILSAAIPAFVGPDDETDGGAGAVRSDANPLKPVGDATRPFGRIEARYANVPRGVNEQIAVEATGMSFTGEPYTVVAIAGDATETTICELSPRNRFGFDRETLDTRDGDVIPGPGSVRDLSEQSVEVRDKDGTVVMTGVFPKVATE